MSVRGISILSLYCLRYEAAARSSLAESKKTMLLKRAPSFPEMISPPEGDNRVKSDANARGSMLIPLDATSSKATSN